MAAYAAVLTALAFSQSPGKIVPDTKFDLVAAPWRFLAGATRMWDARAAFGQLQNQADGYFWPMGPFFLLGKLVALPEWAIQRLWWALLLNLAFFGVLRLLKDLRLGQPWTQVAAAAAYILAPRITTVLGASSVELWPTAIAPWVLIPLVRGSQRGSVVRAAALSALAVATCGGVNATAVSAVIPAGVLWILTRERGPRTWRLLGWWALFTFLATLWWLVPLVLQARYSAPFLDYIETGAITSSVTDLTNSLLGTSNWTAYLGEGGYPAGATLVTTPFLLLDAAAVAAVGLAGIAMRDHLHRRFLVLLLVSGLVLVGLGHTGDVHGWWASDRQSLLDGALAALRNTHKYDVLIRLALTIGIAHALAVWSAALKAPAQAIGEDLRAAATRYAPRILVAATVVALAGLASPWAAGQVASPGGFTATPAYWSQVAAYLDDHSRGTSLVVPAAQFGDYTWGSTHDDVLQPLVDSRWAVRNAVPLAQPGNVVLLDEVTKLLEAGMPSDRLAPLLAAAGVTDLVVRNDLDRFITGAPDPAYLHAALNGAPGLVRIAAFGPKLGEARSFKAHDGTHVVRDRGLAGRYRAVEIYRVAGATGEATRRALSTSVMGDPGTGLPLTGDVSQATAGQRERVVLTDGLRRQETAFQAVRDNRAATGAAGSMQVLPGPAQFHRIFPDQGRWQTKARMTGVAYAAARTSQSDASATPPLVPGDLPAAALDGDLDTAWRTPRNSVVDGQWLQVGLRKPRAVHSVWIAIPRGVPVISRLRITAGTVTHTVDAPRPGDAVTVALGAKSADSVRVAAVAPDGLRGSWGIAELTMPGVSAARVLALPRPPTGAVVDEIRLARDPGTTACPSVSGTVTCLAYLGQPGEDGDQLNRSVRLRSPAAYDVAGTASLRRDPGISGRLARAMGVGLHATRTDAVDVAESPVAMIDGDRGTTWHAADGATIHLRFAAVRKVSSVTLKVGRKASVSAPTRIQVRAGRHSVTGHLDSHGRLRLPGWRTDRLDIKLLSAAPAFSLDGRDQQQLGPGVSELRVDGAPLTGRHVRLGCGSGPTVRLGDSVTQTSLSGRLASLLRGAPVRLHLCGPERVGLHAGRTTIAARPSALVRTDTLTLTTPRASIPPAASVPVTRDANGAPVSATVTSAATPTVLTLPQNANDGWVATLDGHRLTPQRVDGWQQGWVVPAGASGTVRFDYPPDTPYRAGLLAGLVGLLLVAAVALVARERRQMPALVPARSPAAAVLEGALVIGAAGLLGGWAGVLVLVAAVAAQRIVRDDRAWAQIAGAAVVLACVPRLLTGLDGLAAAGQWCALVAIALVAGSPLAESLSAGSVRAKWPTFLSRRNGFSSHR